MTPQCAPLLLPRDILPVVLNIIALSNAWHAKRIIWTEIFLKRINAVIPRFTSTAKPDKTVVNVSPPARFIGCSEWPLESLLLLHLHKLLLMFHLLHTFSPATSDPLDSRLLLHLLKLLFMFICCTFPYLHQTTSSWFTSTATCTF